MGSAAVVVLVLMQLLSACKKDNTTAEAITFTAPAHFPAVTYPFASNPVTTDGFVLGRKLFYDTRLSRDNSISCGSCHIQYSAFTHHGHTVSHGIDDKLGARNAPAVQNMAWSTSYFWDGGVHNLDMLPFNPIQNPVEMDERVSNIVTKLKNDAEYKALMKKAFGTEDFTAARMMQAMSQFMCMLVSANSKYDQYITGNTAVFSTDEKAGYTLFKTHCANCHKEPLFTDFSFRNNGLDTTNDLGRYSISLIAGDEYKFKVPSLRNVEKTAPYMHRGQILSLESVIDHYRFHIVPVSTLDSSLQNGITLTNAERAQLIAFLKTLTDDTFLHNTRFSEQ